MPPREVVVVLALLSLGCAPRRAPEPSPLPALGTIEALAADSIGNALIARALTGDAAMTIPDSLYLDDAEIIANGEPRADAPRFAGVAKNGTVQLGSSRIAVTGNFVWGTVEYRWLPKPGSGEAKEGRATFVIGRTRTGLWRILHVHSSTPNAERPAPPAAGSTGR